MQLILITLGHDKDADDSYLGAGHMSAPTTAAPRITYARRHTAKRSPEQYVGVVCSNLKHTQRLNEHTAAHRQLTVAHPS